MNMKMPQVRPGADGKLAGWNEFESWALHNEPVWDLAARTRLNEILRPEEQIKLTAYLLTLEIHQLRKMVSDAARPLYIPGRHI